jgi:hypothetical protein
LSLQLSDQLFGPINRDLIAYRKQYSFIPLNRFVDLDALIAHRSPSLKSGGSNQATCYLMTATTLFCFNDKLEPFDSVRLRTDLRRLYFRGLPRFAKKSPCMSAALRKMPAFFRASVFSCPTGIKRAVSRASMALASKSLAS